MPEPRQQYYERGFSLIELVTVLVLVGVVGALLLPRMVGTGSFADHAALDQVLSGLRYAQQQAMSRGKAIRFRYGGKQYVVEYDDGTQVSGTSQWRLPGDARFANPSDRSVTFNGLGAASCSDTEEIALERRGSINVHCATGFASAG